MKALLGPYWEVFRIRFAGCEVGVRDGRRKAVVVVFRTAFAAFALALLLVQAFGFPLQLQKPQGSIEGAVLRLGSTEPVARVRLTLTRYGAREGSPESQKTIAPVMTNETGRFVFSNLDDGDYTLVAEANGYVRQVYGRRFEESPPLLISVALGQANRDIRVALKPAATISGRVYDSSQQPLIHVTVQLLRSAYTFDGRHTLATVAATRTNDRGEYRMYWVDPGHYYLLAGRPSRDDDAISNRIRRSDGGGPNGSDIPPVTGYTFYPGVPDVGSAKAIDLQPGADLHNVDMALAANARTYSLRGQVIDSRTGTPPARANVSAVNSIPLVDTDQIGGPDQTNRNYNGSTGEFEIRGLLPGTYRITARSQDPQSPEGQPPSYASGSILATIASADATGLVVNLVPAASIPGHLILEGKLQTTLDRLKVGLLPVEPTAAERWTAYTGSVGVDGTFRVDGVPPGDYRIEISSGARLPYLGGFLKDARYEGTDLLRKPLHFTGTSVGRLDIVVTAGGGKLEGTVRNLQQQAVPATDVVLIPDRDRFRTDLYRPGWTDKNGHFTLTSIAPGDYHLFTWESIDQFSWFEPGVLQRFEARGRAVHVSEFSSEAIEIQWIPAGDLR